MNTLQTQDSICEAIDIIVQQAINNAGFDRTIQATIVSCTDESIGQYKVRYQNSTFYAYAQSEEDKYSEGAGVYILIQNNDMSRDKFIIGTVDKLGKDYITIVDFADIWRIFRTEIVDQQGVQSRNSIPCEGGKILLHRMVQTFSRGHGKERILELGR